MTLKKAKPTSPGRRQLIQIDKSKLYKKGPHKDLTVGLINTGGRNNQGRITAFHRGGGNKTKYRKIDFKRLPLDIPGKVEQIEYDPNRSSFIALISYEKIKHKELIEKNNSQKKHNYSYIIAPQNISEGRLIYSGDSVDIKVGNSTKLSNIPIGTSIHNVELKSGKGGQVARAAGTHALLIKKSREDSSFKGAIIKLPSGQQINVPLNATATIGEVSNQDNKNINLGKAGRSRWLGRRPVVRGVAMNPIDHPHGGGEGRTSGGRCSVTPWGRPTKGKKTRKK